MAQVIKTTFKFRRNLASYWAEKNPVLAEGEPCFELDTGKLKIGNGTTAYNDLSYINSTTTVIILTFFFFWSSCYFIVSRTLLP